MTGERKAHLGLIDTVRGLCILSMVAYHAMYDVVYLQGIPISWYPALPGYLWQQSICWTFILISGLCWQMGHHPVKRGLIVAGCGGAITLVTWFFMPGQLIQYGILSLMGLSMLLTALLRPLLDKLPPALGLGLSFCFFFLLRNVPAGALGFEGLRLMELPSWLYASPLTAVLGLPHPGFTSTDYFPLIPWFFLYLCGYFLWSLLKDKTPMLSYLRPGFPPLAFLGRHSLLIYVLHQPVLMLVFMVI